MGSTIVLIFEAPKEGFHFHIQPLQKVKMGQSLGDYSPNNLSEISSTSSSIQSHPIMHSLEELILAHPEDDPS
jgi:hypothetical protein